MEGGGRGCAVSGVRRLASKREEDTGSEGRGRCVWSLGGKRTG